MDKSIADPIVQRRGIESFKRVFDRWARPLGRSETVALIALEAYLDLLTQGLWIKLYDSHIKMH